MKTIQTFFICLLPLFAWSQDEILLQNPSFEGPPAIGRMNQKVLFNSTLGSMEGWINCGLATETAPDIHPNTDPNDPFFAVDNIPYHGKTYLGMIVRESNSWESIGQKLQSPLKKQQAYQLSVHLAKSPTYLSPTFASMQAIKHNKAVILRLWGGKDSCSKDQLLAETTSINHTHWKTYTLTFCPQEDWAYIQLEAYYKRGTTIAYNGNLLVDQLSPIRSIDNPTFEQAEVVQPPQAAPMTALTDAPDLKADELQPQQIMALLEDKDFFKRFPSATLPEHFQVIHHNWQFKEEVLRNNLRFYLMNFDGPEKFEAQLHPLRVVGMEESTAFLDQISHLYFRHSNGESLTAEESTILETANQRFREIFRKEDLKDHLSKYIETHLPQLRAEYQTLE